jgi:hypothetical protein
MTPRLGTLPVTLAAAPGPVVPPRCAIAVVVPLPSCEYDPLKPYDEDYFDRAVDTILSEQAALEEPQDDMDNLEMEGSFGYASTSDSTRFDIRNTRHFSQSLPTELKSPHSAKRSAPSTPSPVNSPVMSTKPTPTPATSITPTVYAPDWEDRAIFAAVGHVKRMQVLEAISKNPLMLKCPLLRSERIHLTTGIRAVAANAGMEEANIDALIEYVRLVYFDTHHLIMTENNESMFGFEIEDPILTHPERSHRKRRHSTWDSDEGEKPKKSNKKRRRSKKEEGTHKAPRTGDSAAPVNGEELANVSESQKIGEAQVDEHQDIHVSKKSKKSDRCHSKTEERSHKAHSTGDLTIAMNDQEPATVSEPQENGHTLADQNQDHGVSKKSKKNKKSERRKPKTDEHGPNAQLAGDLLSATNDQEPTTLSVPEENAQPQVNEPKDHEVSKMSKKSERRKSKTEERDHKAQSSGNSNTAMNGQDPTTVSKSEENAHPQVNKPQDHDVLNPRAKWNDTAQASHGKSSDMIHPTEPRPNNNLHSRRNTSLHSSRQNGHPIVGSLKSQESQHSRPHQGPVRDSAQVKRDSSKRKRARQAEKRRTRMSESKQPEDAVDADAVAEELILLPSYHQDPTQLAVKERHGTLGDVKQPQDVVDHVIQKQTLPFTHLNSRVPGQNHRATMDALNQPDDAIDSCDLSPEDLILPPTQHQTARRSEKKRAASTGLLKKPEDAVDTVAQEISLPVTHRYPAQCSKTKRAANMGSLKRPEVAVDVSVENSLLPSASQRDSKRHAGKKRGASMGHLTPPGDPADADAAPDTQEPVLPTTPQQNLTRHSVTKHRATIGDLKHTEGAIAQNPILPSTPRRNVTKSPQKHSPFPPLPANPAEWDLDFF